MTNPDFSLDLDPFNDLVEIGHEVPQDTPTSRTDPRIVKDRLNNKMLFKITVASYAGPPFTCYLDCELSFEKKQSADLPLLQTVEFGLRIDLASEGIMI